MCVWGGGGRTRIRGVFGGQAGLAEDATRTLCSTNLGHGLFAGDVVAPQPSVTIVLSVCSVHERSIRSKGTSTVHNYTQYPGTRTVQYLVLYYKYSYVPGYNLVLLCTVYSYTRSLRVVYEYIARHRFSKLIYRSATTGYNQGCPVSGRETFLFF